MAEALKTFREGEDILASETNENNQFLLSKLSDNAAQVQQYVEGEVATIKSNVASVQATLQNNIDEKLDREHKTEIVGWAMPDYSKGVPISKNYTAPSDGLISYYGVWLNSTFTVTINGNVVLTGGDSATGSTYNNGTFLVSKGDVITGINGGTWKFFPLKGVANDD